MCRSLCIDVFESFPESPSIWSQAQSSTRPSFGHFFLALAPKTLKF